MTLIDPGDCSHPADRQHDNGIQRDQEGRGQLFKNA